MSDPIIKDDKLWCPLCKDYCKLMKLQSAARLVDAHAKTIRRYVEEGRVYAVKVAGKSYRVCSRCLLRPYTRA